MVMEITSLRDGGADCFDLIEAVPFLQVYGQAEETYLSLLGDVSNIGFSFSESKIKSAFGKVDIPLSDRDFYTRHRDVLIVKSLRASRHIVEIVKLADSENFSRPAMFVPWTKSITDIVLGNSSRNDLVS